MNNLVLSILIQYLYKEFREVMQDKDSDILLGLALYNSVKLRLSADLAGRDEWNYYSLNRLEITILELTMKFNQKYGIQPTE